MSKWRGRAARRRAGARRRPACRQSRGSARAPEKACCSRATQRLADGAIRSDRPRTVTPISHDAGGDLKLRAVSRSLAIRGRRSRCGAIASAEGRVKTADDLNDRKAPLGFPQPTPPCQAGPVQLRGPKARCLPSRADVSGTFPPLLKALVPIHHCLRPCGPGDARRTVVPPFTGASASLDQPPHRCGSCSEATPWGIPSTRLAPDLRHGPLENSSQTPDLPFRTRPALAVRGWSQRTSAMQSGKSPIWD